MLLAACASPAPPVADANLPTLQPTAAQTGPFAETALPSGLPPATFTQPPPSPAPTLAPTLAPTQTPQDTPTVTPQDAAGMDSGGIHAGGIRFAVIGDYGDASQAEQDVSNLVKSWEPEFILTTGDNNYPSGSAETIDQNIGQFYSEYIFPYTGRYGAGASENRFFPVLGNHDWGTPGAKPYLDYFTLPGNERYYDFTWGPVHFFALNSDPREPDGVSSNSVQAGWLQERLLASTATWKIVYMHAPPYSSGTHGSTAWMQWPYAEWGASAVLSGHDHTYERLIIGGLSYLISGMGGGARYSFPSILEGSQVRFSEDSGAMLVEADENQMTFQFITRQGILIDTFTITSNGP